MVALVVVALAMVAAASGPASARPRAKSDDALVAGLLGHASKLSAILEKDVDRPRQALAAIDRYLKKHRKPMKQTVTKLVAVVGELDDDDRSALSRELLWGERTGRLVAAISAFLDKHDADPRYEPKLAALLEEIERTGKPLLAALLR